MPDTCSHILPGGLKGAFPFSLATTSYIYPAGWEENVRRLGPYVDEIELLFFESRYSDSLPQRKTVASLVQSAADLNIRYNVHLPVDVRLGAKSARVRQRDVDVLKHFFSRLRCLPASTHTLHLVYDQSSRDPQAIECWRDRLHGSLCRLLEWGVPAPRLSIENLNYPLDWLAPVLLDLELAVCLDIGHLLIHAQDLPAALRQWAQITTIIHLHGVAGGRDHLALDCLPQEHLRSLMPFLRSFDGVLSLEVFNVENLQRSMAYLWRCWRAWAVA